MGAGKVLINFLLAQNKFSLYFGFNHAAIEFTLSGDPMRPIPVIDYLEWAKERILDFQSKEEPFFNLSFSSMSEPRALLSAAMQRMHTCPPVPAPRGNPRLLHQIATRYRIPQGNIQITHGVSAGLFLVCQACLESGDRVLVEKPVYEPIVRIPEYLGAAIDRLERDPREDFGIDPDRVKRLMHRKTKLILITNLHNPSGRHLSEQELLSVLEAARTVNPRIRVVVDEVYHDFLGPVPTAAGLDDGLVSINSLTKVYGLGILHCGWVLASGEIRERIRKTFELMENVGSPVTEALASDVMEHFGEYTRFWQDAISVNRAEAERILKPLWNSILDGFWPEFGCILSPRIPWIQTAEPVVDRLASEGVFVVPGRFFDMPQHIRIGIGGVSENVKQGLERLAGLLEAERHSGGR